jgi:hypothetical protein
MEIETVKRMAKRGTLEVEHLFRLLKSPSPELASDLEALAVELDWKSGPQFPAVPFGDWVTVIAAYCRNGYSGLVTSAADPSRFDFVIGLLETLSTLEALHTLELILKEQGAVIAADPLKARKLAGAINIVGISLDKISANPQAKNIEVLRKFLNDQVVTQSDEAGRGLAICALRFFGDSGSLAIIMSAPPMPEVWESARTVAIRSIRKRLRQKP